MQQRQQNMTSHIVANILKTLGPGMKQHSESQGEILAEQLHNSAIYFSEAYRMKPMSVSYDTLYHRYAYIYKYTTSHGEIIDHALCSCEDLQRKWASKNTLRVASFGGGPGSDVLGVARFLTMIDQSQEIHYVNYDRQEGWKSFFHTTCDEISKHYLLKVIPQLIQFDIIEQQAPPERCKDTDLFIFNYVLTEMHQHGPKVRQFLKKVVAAAKPGAVFIIVDNGHSGSNDYNGFMKNMVSECPFVEKIHIKERYQMQSPRDFLFPYNRLFNHDPLCTIESPIITVNQK